MKYGNLHHSETILCFLRYKVFTNVVAVLIVFVSHGPHDNLVCQVFQ